MTVRFPAAPREVPFTRENRPNGRRNCSPVQGSEEQDRCGTDGTADQVNQGRGELESRHGSSRRTEEGRMTSSDWTAVRRAFVTSSVMSRTGFVLCRYAGW